MAPVRKLLAKIHIAKKQLGIDDAVYREILRQEFGVDSSRFLDNRQANKLIERFKSAGWQEKNTFKKFDDLGRRDVYAPSPKALRKIEAMWHDIYRGNSETSHLRQFLFKQFRVSDLRFLERHQAYQCIEALKAMAARKGVV